MEVSKLIFGTKYLFLSIFQDLQDNLYLIPEIVNFHNFCIFWGQHSAQSRLISGEEADSAKFRATSIFEHLQGLETFPEFMLRAMQFYCLYVCTTSHIRFGDEREMLCSNDATVCPA